MEKITTLWKASLRQGAIYLPTDFHSRGNSTLLTVYTHNFAAQVAKLGFTFSEPLLWAVDRLNEQEQASLFQYLADLAQVDQNWVPLVKDWDKPVKDSWINQLITYISNSIRNKATANTGKDEATEDEPLSGTILSCGHLIPEGTFPLERYNGCPFCGMPFEVGTLELKGQGSKLKVLELWGEAELEQHFQNLVSSKTALDTSQADSLQGLLRHFPAPQADAVSMKETAMLLIEVLFEEGRTEEAQSFFQNPNDILRFLWYKHTGLLQLVEPKTILRRRRINFQHPLPGPGRAVAKPSGGKQDLKLKYSRKECKQVAYWLNNLSISAEKACEIMHPRRRMWVRFIRALRLAEYSKKAGFEKLARLMDVFYNQKYTVLEGQIQHFRLRMDAEQTFKLLKQRPGLFSRSLFANMLWFGPEVTVKHFSEVADQVPTRLLLTLSMYATTYFDPTKKRSIKGLGGKSKTIPANPLLRNYDAIELPYMATMVEQLALDRCKSHFSSQQTEAKSIYIAEELANMPLAIGDRSETMQQYMSILAGTQLPVEGNKLRLFIHWGIGLPAQHLDMDLSCKVLYEEEEKNTFCSYQQLTIDGCQHSGDYQYIPDQVGAAEYIEIDLEKLKETKARYVAFTVNAYSRGRLAPNMIFGWMASEHEMSIDPEKGTAYDPSCVQQQILISGSATKGLMLGVLDVQEAAVIWMEFAFDGQVIQELKQEDVEALLEKTNRKMSIGDLLKIKAEAQKLEIVDKPEEADEVYTKEWGIDSAAVSQLL